MGNTSGAAISVTVDTPQIIPGNVVNGRVFLGITKDKVEAESLMLHLTGGEYSCVRYTTKIGKQTQHHRRYASYVFLNLAFPLTTVDGAFYKGQYEFPFSFVLPPGVLPSMRAVLGGSHGGDCSVKYSLEAKLHRRGWFKWDVVNKQELWVLGPMVNTISNYVTYKPPEEYPLNFFCCYNRGCVRVGLYTTTSLLAAGETFDVNYVIQNNSTSTIKAMEIFLIEQVTWSAAGHGRVQTTELFHKRLSEQEMQVDLTPMAGQSASVGGSAEITNVEVLAKLKEILDSCRYRYPATVPATARTSMDGVIIDVRHFIKIRIATPFGTSDPEIFAPILVHRHGIQATAAAEAQLILPSAPQLPADWHPTVAPSAQLPVPPFPQATRIEGETEDLPGPTDYTVIPSAPMSTQGTAALFQALAATYNQPIEFTKWCQSNNPNTLSPQDIGMVFKSLRSIFDQIAIAEQYANACPQISCAHIAAAVMNANASVKIDVVRKLSLKCSDKSNKNTVKAQLSAFEWMCVENCFN